MTSRDKHGPAKEPGTGTGLHLRPRLGPRWKRLRVCGVCVCVYGSVAGDEYQMEKPVGMWKAWGWMLGCHMAELCQLVPGALGA